MPTVARSSKKNSAKGLGYAMSKLKPKPTFMGVAQEAAFWTSYYSTEYVDYSKSRRMVFLKL